MKNKVGIVIVSYNASHAVRATLAGIRQAKNDTPYTLILVDNASEYLERKRIRHAFDIQGGESWYYLQQNQNLGFSGGNNVGIRLLLEEEAITHICLLNSDVVVTDYWLDRLIEKRCDVVSPVTNKAESEQCVPVDYKLNLSDCLDQKTERLNPKAVEQIRIFAEKWFCAWQGNLVEADVTFFCVLFTKEVVNKVGLLDEVFFPGGYEDDDYCLRAREGGYRIYLARDVFIHHWGSASFGQLRYDYFSTRAQQNREYLERKHNIVWKSRHDTPFVSFLMDARYAVGTDGNRILQKYFVRLYVKTLSVMLAHIDSEFRRIRQTLLNSQAPLPNALGDEIAKVHLLGNLTTQWKDAASKVERWLDTPQLSEEDCKNLLDRLDALMVQIGDKINITLAMNPLAACRSMVQASRPRRVLSLLKRGMPFLWKFRGIVFFGGYPYPERQSDGYFQRIQIVDRLFIDRWRIYIETDVLPGRGHWFDRPESKVLVLRIVGGRRRRWLIKGLALLAVLRCRKIYIHSVLRMQGNGCRALMHIPGITKAIDIHGAVPEEFRLHNDFYSALLFESHERLAVRKSDLVIVVSEAMKSYLRQKYRSELRGQIAVFPMFLNIAPILTPRPYVDGKPVVIYAGGLQKWQQVGKMIDAIERTVSICAHRFYCPDPDALRNMLSESVRSKIVLDCKTHSELTELYAECHYGFILREDNVVNHVACPTKLVEYLATGIVPIVDSQNMGDFKAMGMRVVTLEQLLQGDLPNELNRAEMAQDNFSIYGQLRKMRKQGAREICAVLADGQEASDVRPSLRKQIRKWLPLDTTCGWLAQLLWRALMFRGFNGTSAVWSPVRRRIEDAAQIDPSIPLGCDVLLQVDNFEAGGLENVVLDLAETLIGSGLKVVLLILGIAGAAVESARQRGIPIVIGTPEANWYRMCLDRIKPRLLLTHYSVHGARLCHERGIPFIQVIHNTYMWLDGAQRAAFDEAARFTTVFVAVSEYAKHYSVRRLGIKESRCLVIPNGIDTKDFETIDKREARRKIGGKYGLHDEDFVFLSVGAINHQKNHIATVRAFADAAEDFPNAKLVIVGPTSEKELLKEIERFVEIRMLDKRVIYAGATSEVRDYYAMADAFVSASFFEGGPLNQLEAARAKLPAVLTNVGFASHFAELPGFQIIEPAVDIAKFHGAIWQLSSTSRFEDCLSEAMIKACHNPQPPDLPTMVLNAFDKSHTYTCYVELIGAFLQGLDPWEVELSASWPNKLSSLSKSTKTDQVHAVPAVGRDRADANKNPITELRRRLLDKRIDISKLAGLEIGPHNQPMVKRHEGSIKYLDYLSRAEQIALNPNASYQDEIPETDYIVKSNDYLSCVHKKFDYVIANHVLEHAPNFIGFLQQLSEMLNDGGVLFIALPDKKFTFDKYKPSTSLSHILADYVNKVEKATIEHVIEDFLYYDRRFAGRDQNVEERLSITNILNKISAEPHIGLHCHVFESESVLNTIVKPILAMNLVKFNLLDFSPAAAERGGEVIMLFRKEPSRQEISEIEFLSTDRATMR